jgi:outer membrane protein
MGPGAGGRRGKVSHTFSGTALAILVAATLGRPDPSAGQAGQVIDLTFDRVVELGLEDSYRVQQVQLGVERTRSLLEAEQADLKSRVDLEIATPEFEAISDEKWNPDLGRNEIVHTNTRLWQANLSVRQPVILFGYPTNGFLSLNSRLYRYSQIESDEGGETVSYYNRYYVAYEQPLFQPNRMKNELEEAELDLESAELEYRDDVVDLIDDLADDYSDLLETAFEGDIARRRVADLTAALEAAEARVPGDSTRAIDVDQLQVELANADEQVQQSASSLRLQMARLKQRLRIDPSDSLALAHRYEVVPVVVDPERAIRLAATLAPVMRELEIRERDLQRRLEETRGHDSFRLDLQISYGREMQDPRFDRLWGQPRNSYTVSLNGSVPIWDWGARRHRIRADQFSLERHELATEEVRTSIEVSINSEVRNLQDSEGRAFTMDTNLDRARQLVASTIERYRGGTAALIDVLQAVDREETTAENFLDAYIGYRQALLALQRLTHYDFRTGQPVFQRFGIE